jgi:hypothetical protein
MPLTPNTPTRASRCSSAANCLEATWTKSSYSSDSFNCVEARRWTKSSRSGGNGCVEIFHNGVVQLRDSKDQRPDAPILEIPVPAWTEFITAIRNGQYEKGNP